MKKLILYHLIFFLTNFIALAQNQELVGMYAVKVEGPLSIDGELNEKVWQGRGIAFYPDFAH